MFIAPRVSIVIWCWKEGAETQIRTKAAIRLHLKHILDEAQANWKIVIPVEAWTSGISSLIMRKRRCAKSKFITKFALGTTLAHTQEEANTLSNMIVRILEAFLRIMFSSSVEAWDLHHMWPHSMVASVRLSPNEDAHIPRAPLDLN